MNDFTQEAQLRSVYEICLDHSLGIINAEDAMKAVGGVILHRQLYYSKKLAKAVQAAEERKHNEQIHGMEEASRKRISICK